MLQQHQLPLPLTSYGAQVGSDRATRLEALVTVYERAQDDNTKFLAKEQREAIEFQAARTSVHTWAVVRMPG